MNEARKDGQVQPVVSLNPCPKCGGEAKHKCSFGGSTVYYGIYCQKCGHDNRTHNSAIFAFGLGNAGGFPPQDRDQAIEEWNAQRVETNNRIGKQDG